MGDVGEYWRDAREYRRARRVHWHECLSPGCQFGGNPVKVPPGEPCRHCGVVAPGARGEDKRKADVSIEITAKQQERAERRRRESLQRRTCTLCAKVLFSAEAVRSHMRDKHKRTTP